jgi:hypothetical protein
VEPFVNKCFEERAVLLPGRIPEISHHEEDSDCQASRKCGKDHEDNLIRDGILYRHDDQENSVNEGGQEFQDEADASAKDLLIEWQECSIERDLVFFAIQVLFIVIDDLKSISDPNANGDHQGVRRAHKKLCERFVFHAAHESERKGRDKHKEPGIQPVKFPCKCFI